MIIVIMSMTNKRRYGNMEYPNPVEFPHYFAFLVREGVKANQKRQDRELVEQFGNVPGEDEGAFDRN